MIEEPAAGHVRDGRHRLPLRVYYEDTDFSGLVYHASYLRFFERGRTELLRAFGFGQRAAHERGGEAIAFVVRRMAIDFLRPARMDDSLIVETAVSSIRGASVALAQTIWRGREALVLAEVEVAAVAGGRARRLPSVLRDAFRQMAEAELAPQVGEDGP